MNRSLNPSRKSPDFNPRDEYIVLSAQEEAPGFSPGSFTSRNLLNSKGFTLAEVILAAAILVFALSGLLSLFISCALLNEANRNLSVAMAHAQYVMEEIKHTDFGSIQDNIESGDWDWDESEIEDAGLVRIRGESIDVSVSGSDPLEVTATVTWNDRVVTGRSISLESAFTEIAT